MPIVIILQFCFASCTMYDICVGIKVINYFHYNLHICLVFTNMKKVWELEKLDFSIILVNGKNMGCPLHYIKISQDAKSQNNTQQKQFTV